MQKLHVSRSAGMWMSLVFTTLAAFPLFGGSDPLTPSESFLRSHFRTVAVDSSAVFERADEQVKDATFTGIRVRKEPDVPSAHPGVRFDLIYPDSYDGSFVALLDGQRVALAPRKSETSSAILSRGKVFYEDAYPATSVIQVPRDGGSEELLVLRDVRAPKVFEYDITEMSGVRDVVIDGGAIHFLASDSRGTPSAAPQFFTPDPHLQIERPWVIDATGCRSETAARWSIVRDDGTIRLRLTLDPTSLVYPLVIDPSFTTDGTMTALRNFFTATVLLNGKILFTGGESTGGGIVPTAELYDPFRGTFTATGSMTVARASHTATLLTNGKVLITGGRNDSTTRMPSCDLYDPATGLFTSTFSIQVPRTGHAATRLANGDVLITGGDLANTAEVYPAAGGAFVMTSGNMTAVRARHTATLLPNGKVLITGGNGAISNSAELYNPATASFTATGNMSVDRVYHSATVLAAGKVLVTGGASAGTSLQTAELYDPATGAFAPTGNMTVGRRHLTATLLPSGLVLIAGGLATGGAGLATAETYDPAGGTFSSTASMPAARAFHTATLMPSGQVIIAGGTTNVPLLYEQTFWATTTVLPMSVGRASHTATLLPSGKVLVAGGSDVSAGVDLFDPVTESFTLTNSMSSLRAGQTATLLPNAKVLIAGGSTTTAAELYDTATDTFVPAGSMTVSRRRHQASLLPNGLVLITGGVDAFDHALASAEIYDPSSNTFQATASMTQGRSSHVQVLLRDGRVLIVSASTAELYDPLTGAFTGISAAPIAGTPSSSALLPDGRVLLRTAATTHELYLFDPQTATFSSAYSGNRFNPSTSTVMSDGRVLVFGGNDGVSSVPAGEVFTPSLGTDAPATSGNAARQSHTATLLMNGKVLITGGKLGTDPTPTPSAGLMDAFPGAYSADAATRDARRPSIASATASVCQPGTLILSGTSFLSDSEGGTGGIDSSAGNTPLLHLQRVDNQYLAFLPAQFFSSTTLVSSTVDAFASGPYRMTVVSNGVPATERLVEILTAPMIGTYPSASITTSGSAAINPSSLPAGFAGRYYPLFASASGFTGGLAVSGDGVVHAYQPGPPGDYTVNVAASNACGSVSTSFALSVLGPASSVTTAAGSPQGTRISTPFAAPLQAKVTDSANHPLSGVTVVFIAPGAGASATLSAGTAQTDASGIALVTATANATVGSYSVTANVGGLSSSFLLTNNTAPTNVVASALSTSAVGITWIADAGVTYEVQRQSAGGVLSTLGSTASGTFQDVTAAAGTAYLYRVRSISPTVSAYSAPDLATTVIFDDPTITSGVTVVKTAHFTQLRTAVNAVRALAGLTASSFTDPALTSTTVIKRVHLTEIRSSIDSARSTLILAPVAYSRPTITAGSTTIAGADLSELRGAVR